MRARHDTFWVVEQFQNGRSAGYWDGGNSRSFQPDIEKAVQFCRKEDAATIIHGWHWQDVKITEHVSLMMGGARPACAHGPEQSRTCPVCNPE